jgi:tetratricopeptide (TPR) repeat protein
MAPAPAVASSRGLANRPPWILRLRLAVLGLALLAALPNLANEFTLDARFYLHGNRLVTEPGHLVELLTHDEWAGADMVSGRWRPGLGLYHWTMWRVGGGTPLPFMAVNTLLHALVSLLVLEVALLWGAGIGVAAASGLLFAVLPIHVEAFASATGSKDMVAALSLLLTLILHQRARSLRGARCVLFIALGTAVFAAGILFKEMVLALLPLLAAADAFRWWRGGGMDPQAARIALASHLALAAVAVTKVAADRLIMGSVWVMDPFMSQSNPLLLLPPLARRIHALVLLPFYAERIVWPFRLAPDYTFDAVRVTPDLLRPGIFLGGALAALATGSLLLAWRRRATFVFLALCLTGAAFLPVSNLVVPINGPIAADRYLYLPSAGLCLLAGAASAAAAFRFRGARVLLGLILLAALVRCWTRSADWKDNHALWTAAHRAMPASMMATNGALEQHLAREEYAAAIAVADAGISYRGYHPIAEALAARWQNRFLWLRGLAHVRGGRGDVGLHDLREALARDPSRTDWARDYMSHLLQAGRYEEAVREAERLAAAGPDLGELLRPYRAAAHAGRAWELEQAGDLSGALASLEAAIAADLARVEAQGERARLLALSGRLEEAEGAFRALMAAEPGQPLHRFNLALVLEKRGEPGAAAALVEGLPGDPAAPAALRDAAAALLARLRPAP